MKCTQLPTRKNQHNRAETAANKHKQQHKQPNSQTPIHNTMQRDVQRDNNSCNSSFDKYSSSDKYSSVRHTTDSKFLQAYILSFSGGGDGTVSIVTSDRYIQYNGVCRLRIKLGWYSGAAVPFVHTRECHERLCYSPRMRDKTHCAFISCEGTSYARQYDNGSLRFL